MHKLGSLNFESFRLRHLGKRQQARRQRTRRELRSVFPARSLVEKTHREEIHEKGRRAADGRARSDADHPQSGEPHVVRDEVDGVQHRCQFQQFAHRKR